jgi:hypothetical protein
MVPSMMLALFTELAGATADAVEAPTARAPMIAKLAVTVLKILRTRTDTVFPFEVMGLAAPDGRSSDDSTASN